MHIGVDATCWWNERGYGRQARALVGSMIRTDKSNRYTLFVDSENGLDLLPKEASIRRVKSTAPAAQAARHDGHRSAPDLCRMSLALSGPGYDALLFPTIYTYVPVFSRARKIVFVHDVIPEKFPELTMPKLGPRLLWKAKSAFGRWQADAIATVSEYSRAAIVKEFGLSADRVFVVPEASEKVFRLIGNPAIPAEIAKLGVAEGSRFVVYVGGFGPHKNVLGLVEAFARAMADSALAGVRLLLVGKHFNETFHSGALAVQDRARSLGIAHAVTFTGFLPDEALANLLNVASVLVLPSFMEGFGLPAVEAAACGCPVIATTESPIPGLLGPAGIYTDPHDTGALERALRGVLGSEDMRIRMRREGLSAVSRLSWDAAARRMISLLEEIAA